jgi:hypothetical protein
MRECTLYKKGSKIMKTCTRCRSVCRQYYYNKIGYIPKRKKKRNPPKIKTKIIYAVNSSNLENYKIVIY